MRTLALFSKSGADHSHREVAKCNAQLFFGVLHSVGIVVLTHVHSFVAQLCYLR